MNKNIKIENLVRKELIVMDNISWGKIPSKKSMRLLWGENFVKSKELNTFLKKNLTDINLYPAYYKNELCEKIAKYVNLKPENVLPTNGSDSAIELIAKVFICKNDEVLIPRPSYFCFSSVSKMMGAKIIYIDLEMDFSLSLEKLAKAITSKTKIVWIANPNNPTGNMLLSPGQIKKLARMFSGLIVIDECYFEFFGISAVPLINEFKNMVILRSFSKTFSLAGLRLGYIVASKNVIKYLERLQENNQAFGVNSVAQIAGIFLLDNPAIRKSMFKTFLQAKKNFELSLKKIKNIELVTTYTSFCLIKVTSSNKTGATLRKYLEENNIYIKNCDLYPGLGEKYAYLGIPEPARQKKVLSLIERHVNKYI